MLAVSKSSEAIKHLSTTLRADREIVMAAFDAIDLSKERKWAAGREFYDVLKATSEDIRDDKVIVQHAIATQF